MSLLVGGAVASRLTATTVRERKGTRQQVGRNREALEEFELALAKPGGLRASGGDLHMYVIIHTAGVESRAHR
jgi:hypothetical protein